MEWLTPTVRKTGFLLLPGAGLLALSACGSLGDLTRARGEAFDSPGPHVYGGLRLDAVYADPGNWGGHVSPVAICAWVDLPLSLAVDTMLLPFTVPYSFFPEGRDYITVDRAGLEEIISRKEKEKDPEGLYYVGSEGGYHHLRFGAVNRATPHYRIQERYFPIAAPFPYTTDPSKHVALRKAGEPWPGSKPQEGRSTVPADR